MLLSVSYLYDLISCTYIIQFWYDINLTGMLNAHELHVILIRQTPQLC